MIAQPSPEAVELVAAVGRTNGVLAIAMWEGGIDFAPEQRIADDAEEALFRYIQKLEADKERLDYLESMLRPLPWGGVYTVLESDGDSQFRITTQPSSGDAPFIDETGERVRDAIDAARVAA